MSDDVPRVRRFVLVDYTLDPPIEKYHDSIVRTLTPLDCEFAIHAPDWGDGKSFFELFMPEVEPDISIEAAATYIASRLIFDHRDEEWSSDEEPYDSTVIALNISKVTDENEAFRAVIEALQKRLKELGNAQLAIEAPAKAEQTDMTAQ